MQITPLHQELELTSKLVIEKYSFRNIISFGLFNFFKKKKIKEINQEISYLRGQINHFNDKKSQIKTKIIENYKTIFKKMKDVSVQTDNVNNKQRINSI